MNRRDFFKALAGSFLPELLLGIETEAKLPPLMVLRAPPTRDAMAGARRFAEQMAAEIGPGKMVILSSMRDGNDNYLWDIEVNGESVKAVKHDG